MRDQRGFTLTELLVAVAVLAFIMAGLLTLQRQGQFAYLVGAARVEAQQSARYAIEAMTADLRSALAITAVGAGCNTGPVPTAGGATTISLTDVGSVAVQYQLVGTNLQRNGTTIVGGVGTLRIWCYDSSGTLTVTPANVRSVQIWIQTRSEQAVAGNAPQNQTAVLETTLRLRNIL